MASHSESMQVGSMVFNRSVTLDGDNVNVYGGTGNSAITLSAGKVVTSWVYSAANSATCNLPSGHGYTNGNFDVFYTNNAIIRYGVPGTIVTNALTLTGGSGSSFPANGTSGVIVCKQTQVDVDIDGDDAKMIGFSMNTDGHIDCQDTNSASVRAFSLSGDEPDLWDSNEKTNPYTGNPITKVLASNGQSDASGSLKFAILQDSTS